MKHNSKEISSECKCGMSVANVIAQYWQTRSFQTEKGLERRLHKLKERLTDIGSNCKIQVDDPISRVSTFLGYMDSIGYRETPSEGINHYNQDINDFFDVILNSIYDSLETCIGYKTPIKFKKK